MSQIFNFSGSGGSGGSAILTINTIGPDGSGNFTISAGTGITIAPETNGIQISTSSSGLSFTDEATNFTAVSNHAYFCTAALTATLPASPSQGDEVYIFTDTASNVIVQASAGQTIRIGSNASSIAGTVSVSVQGSVLQLYFRADTSTWFGSSPQASWAFS